MATQSGATVVVNLSQPKELGQSVSGYTAQRLTDRNGPSLEVGELTSGEVSAERQETSVRTGFRQVTGQLGFELSPDSQDDLIELGTAEAFTAVANQISSESLTYVPASGSDAEHFTYTGTNLDNDDKRVAMFETGSTSTDQRFIGRVDASSGKVHVMVKMNAVTLASGTFSEVAASESRVKKSNMLYSTIHKSYPDVALEQLFNDVTVNNLSLSIQPGSLVTGTADLIGLSAGDMVADGTAGVSANAAPTTTAYSPFASCVGIGDKPVGVVSGLDFTVNNNRETVPLLCSPSADSVYEGVANVTGTVTLLFEDAVEYNKFQDEEETTLTVALKDVADGTSIRTMIVHFPRVRYNQPSFEVPANGPVVLTLNFRALQAEVKYGSATGVQTSAIFHKVTA